MYRPGSYSSTGGYGDRYEDDRYEGRYGSRDEDMNGYGKERDDDRYGRYGDSSSRDGDRYGRDYEERSSRDGYRDDDYRGRSRSVDDNQYGSRSRSSDIDKDRAFDDDGQYSSRYVSSGRDIYVISSIKNSLAIVVLLSSCYLLILQFLLVSIVGFFCHLSMEEAN
jgi:hypothetical protein